MLRTFKIHVRPQGAATKNDYYELQISSHFSQKLEPELRVSRRNLHLRVKVEQAGRPLPPKKALHFDRLSVETDNSAKSQFVRFKTSERGCLDN